MAIYEPRTQGDKADEEQFTHPLLVSSTQRIFPVSRAVPSALTLDNVLHLDNSENIKEILVCLPAYEVIQL